MESEETDDLPSELLAQLSPKNRKMEQRQNRLTYLMEQRNGVISVDHLLLGWYRQHGEIVKRTRMVQWMHILVRKGVVELTPGKHGVYKLKSPD